ncbi:amino acid ABC transporter permease [Brevibacillus fluminis]|uniref:Amino acid ABC transporter permease n=1 Tax=Brevibacillus fluminis TaxID=511487 RepID=A0A3M8DB38_9BACL|nr:amino acid ABC transporter permease [Brevibacillus fluminis]RNB84525.1 amino acid ABC transporter permease [Brevibacillus fluminis]
MLDFSLVTQFFPFLLEASWLTLELTVLSTILGLILGLIAALMKISNSKPLMWLADFYLWVIRGTPVLVQILLMYFALPQFGIQLDAFVASVLALGINAGAYIAEIYRGGILSVPKGQVEAAESLGMTYPTIMRRVVLPQALRVSFPALGNQAISMLKDSSMASVITLPELMMTSQRFAATNYAFFEFYIVAAGLYLLMTTILSFFLNKMERRMSQSER